MPTHGVDMLDRVANYFWMGIMPISSLAGVAGARGPVYALLGESLGTAIDADCFAHLQKIIRTSPEFFPG